MAAPSTAVLDTFNRANGSIATGESRWTTPGLYQGSVAVLISGNQAYGSASFAEAYWNAATYTDCEVGLTIATPQGTGQYVYVWARGQSPNASGASGYELLIERLSGTDQWTLNRVNSQSPTQLATRTQEISAGDAFALVVLGTGATVTLQIWYRASGGSWTQLGADVSDTSGSRITTAGRIGFGSNSTTIRIDDVFGGAQSAAATYTGSGALALPAAGLAGSGTFTAPAPGTFIGAGALTLPAVGLSGAGAFTGPPEAVYTGAGGGPGRGLRLYGTADDGIDRVRFPLTTGGGAASTPINVGAGDFTYELWLRCAYADNTTTATDVRYSNIILDRDIWDHPRGHVPLGVTRRSGVLVLIFGANNGSGAWPAIRGTTQVGDGAWHHVAVVRDGATVRLFVDGAQDASGTFSTADWSYPLSYTPTGGLDNEYLVLGAEKHDFDPGVNGFAGRVDELRISSTARYTGAFTPPAAPFAPDATTVGLYHLDSQSGTTALDSATVSGAPTPGELRVGGPDNGPTWDAESPFTQAGGLALPAVGLAGAGAFVAPVSTGAGALAMTGAALGGAGAHVAPVYAGGGGLALPAAALAGTGAFTAPVYTGAGAAALPGLTVAGAGAHVTPTYTGAGALTLPGAGLDGSGIASPPGPVPGAGAVALPALGLACGGTFVAPPATGGGALALPGLALVGVGAFAAPVYAGAGALGLAGAGLAGVGAFAAPGAGVGALALPALGLTGAGAFVAPGPVTTARRLTLPGRPSALTLARRDPALTLPEDLT